MTRYAMWVTNAMHNPEAYTPKTFADEAAESMATVKQQMPGLATLLVSPLESYPGFDRCIQMKTSGKGGWWGWYPESTAWFSLVLRQLETGDEVLYLDTDTYMLAPVWELFELLPKFDLTGTHGIRRYTGPIVDKVPQSFVELAIGVNTFVVNDAIRSLFADWAERMSKRSRSYHGSDMAAMREALWHWDGRFYVIPEEYNCRFGFGGYVAHEVKILHGRSPNYAAIAAGINRDKGMRVWHAEEPKRWVEAAANG